MAISASPVSELRGGIPVAIGVYHFPWYYAYLFAVIGNLLPVPFALLFLNGIVRILSNVSLFKRIIDWFFARTRSRAKVVERYRRIGLAVFVAIPLPITGAWTGSIVAMLLDLKFRLAFPAIVIGVLIAGIIVIAFTMLGWTLFGLLETPSI